MNYINRIIYEIGRWSVIGALIGAFGVGSSVSSPSRSQKPEPAKYVQVFDMAISNSATPTGTQESKMCADGLLYSDFQRLITDRAIAELKKYEDRNDNKRIDPGEYIEGYELTLDDNSFVLPDPDKGSCGVIISGDLRIPYAFKEDSGILKLYLEGGDPAIVYIFGDPEHPGWERVSANEYVTIEVSKDGVGRLAYPPIVFINKEIPTPTATKAVIYVPIQTPTPAQRIDYQCPTSYVSGQTGRIRLLGVNPTVNLGQVIVINGYQVTIVEKHPDGTMWGEVGQNFFYAENNNCPPTPTPLGSPTPTPEEQCIDCPPPETRQPPTQPPPEPTKNDPSDRPPSPPDPDDDPEEPAP